MDHYIAYHSVRQMGYELAPTGHLEFLSRKIGLLRKAVGSTVWMVQGAPAGKSTAYSLRGAYIAERIAADPAQPGLYIIEGSNGADFIPSFALNGLSWFPALLKTQANFSLGFNRVSDAQVVEALLVLRSAYAGSPTESVLPDIDLGFSATEGASRLVSHLLRERSQSLVEAKKSAVLADKGRLACEVCDFDFSATYGQLGIGFCEVHHKVSLSSAIGATFTTLQDLAIVCSNCHRIIHRADPMLSVEQLSEAVRRGRI